MANPIHLPAYPILETLSRSKVASSQLTIPNISASTRLAATRSQNPQGQSVAAGAAFFCCRWWRPDDLECSHAAPSPTSSNSRYLALLAIAASHASMLLNDLVPRTLPLLDCRWGGASVSPRTSSMTSTSRTRGMLIERFGADCFSCNLPRLSLEFNAAGRTELAAVTS